MGQDSVERFLGRLITDDEFRETVNSSLEQLCFEHGFCFSDEELGIIRSIDLSQFSVLSKMMDKKIKRCRRTLVKR